MKTSTFEKGIPMLPRLGLCLAVVLGALLLNGTGCNQSAEGDRCNPLRTSDECGSGLVCSGNPIGISASYPIQFCPENYCCPADLSQSTNPYCQPGCNGGAAAICAADGTNTGACACADAGECAPAPDAATSSTGEGGGDEASSPDGGG
jgi:hypothetical protein